MMIPAMRMGHIDRRTEATTVCCTVCGTSDVRVLAATRLLGGELVIVCGSHKVAHQRSERIAASVDELRELVGERRQSVA
jgi:hypothetical protein